tara:strand:+ start:71 stop:409 length:339 start_codon:yes stop_codon:yes gene_type:complete
MSIKLSLLKSGEQLISEMKELVAEGQDQAHAYMLENPHIVETRDKTFLTEEEKKTGDFGIDVIMIPWIVLSKDKKMIIPVDTVLTIVEPLDSLTQMYEDKCESFKLTEEEND